MVKTLRVTKKNKKTKNFREVFHSNFSFLCQIIQHSNDNYFYEWHETKALLILLFPEKSITLSNSFTPHNDLVASS